MDKQARKRWTVLGCALALTLLAILYPVDETPAARGERAPRSAAAVAAANAPVAERAPAELETVDVDPFAPRNWQPPAPPAPPPAPTAVAAVLNSEPTAPAGPPPLPFQYMGRMNDDGNIVVYLSHGDQIFLAKPGELLEGTYKVIETSALQVALLHVPSGEKQLMSLPAPDN